MTTTPMKSIEDRVRDLIAKQFGVAPEQLDLNANLHVEFDGDSLDVVEITMGIEDDFDIDVPDEQMAKFTTGQEIVDYVRGNVKA